MKPNYVIVKAKGGMGNRMLCAATGLLYAQLSGRRVIVDWSDITYSNDGTNVFTSFFRCPTVNLADSLPVDGSVRPALWRGQLGRSVSQMLHEHDPNKHNSIRIHRKYSIDVSCIDYEEDVVVFWYYKERLRALQSVLARCGHKYAGLTRTEILRRMLTEDLLPAWPVRERSERFRREHWGEPVIGVHVRYTDRCTDLERYEAPLRRFLRSTPRATVFLCTDNASVQERYRQRFPNLITTPKWFPHGYQTMHQNSECPNKVTNGIEALVDMYLLAGCDYLIYPGGSTFSWIARVLSGLPAERVVDVERFDLAVRLKRWAREALA